MQSSSPAELREPSKGEKDFPSAPLVSLASILTLKSPHTFSVQLFQEAIITPLLEKT